MRYLTVLTVAALPLLALGADEAALEDPVPIKRVLIPAARVAAELERLGQGVLLPMPRDKFEALVQKAARAAKSQRRQPRLVKASYKATLEQDALDGSGAWTVFNTADVAGVLPLPDLNLALSKVKTEVDYKDAVIGDLEGKTCGLLIARAGRQRIDFDWTLRGVPGPNGLHFDLRLPPCAAATLELRIPPDQILVAPTDGVMLSGPHDSESPRLRTWQVYFAGRARLEFLIRKRSSAGVPPLLLTDLQTRQQLTPGRCQAASNFRIDVLHSAMDELVFDCDPGLEPYDVDSSAALQGWEVREAPPGKDKKAAPMGKVLVVKLREPVQGTIDGLKVRCLAATPLDGAWTSPLLRLRNVFARGETLELNVHPNVRLEKWDAGQFRLVKTKSEADGSLTLSAINTGTERGSRPHAILKSRGADLVARQHTWWHVGAKEMTLTTQLALEISRGDLFQLSLGLPAGDNWHIDGVTLNGKELPGNWLRAGRTLLINFDRSVSAAGRLTETATLHIRLRSPFAARFPGAGMLLDFPEAAIIDPCTRTGTLAISADPIYQASVVQSSVPPGAPEASGLWKKTVPAYFFPCRNQPVTGKLHLLPRAYRVNARCRTEMVLASGSAALQTRLELEPVLGNPDTIDLYLSSPPQGRWQWKSADNAVRGMERVPALEAAPHLLRLGLANPWSLLGLQAALPTGQFWRLYLGMPLERTLSLTLETSLEDAKHSNRAWEVPLVSVLNAERMDGAVSVQLGGTELLQVTTTGLQEAGLGELGDAFQAEQAEQQKVWRSFRYGMDNPFPRLTVAGRAVAAGSLATEMCDRGELTTYVAPAGRLLHHFRFQVWNWREQTIAILLPPGTTQILSAKVDSRWIDMISQQQMPEGVQVRLPVPAADRLHRFEIVYASDTHASSWPPWQELFAPAPQLPVAPTCFRRTWRLPPGLVPLEHTGLQCLTGSTGPAQSRPLLDHLRRAWHGGDQLMDAVGVHFTGDSMTMQRQELMSVEAAWQRKSARDWLLGSAFERLALETQASQSLLIDTVALAAAGIRPSTKFPAPKKKTGDVPPFWEVAGLVYVPSPHGPLFTTQREWEKWQSGRSGAFAEVFTASIAEAARYGQDAAGRFCTVDAWLRSGKEANAPSHFQGIAESFPDWTEWESMAAENPERLLVVNGTAVALAGWGVALFLCLLAWRIGSYLPRRWSFRLLLAWLSVAGLGLLWAPPGLLPAGVPVFAAGVCVLLVWYIRVVTRRPALQSNSKPPSVNIVRPSATPTALALLLSGALVPSASSGGPEPVTVYLLAGPAAAPARQTALVPLDLLKRLNDRAGRDTGAVNGAVLVAAQYRGTVTSMRAEFKAVFDFYCSTEQATLHIPLEGIDLKDEAFIDGKPVELVAAPQLGYTVPVGGKDDNNAKGFHRLELAFTVRTAPGQAEQEALRFLIPRLTQSRLELTLPAGSYGIQVKTGTGAQRLTRTDQNAPRLSVDLGRENAVHVRWREGRAAAPAPRLHVRELYLWDLRPPAPALNGLLQYSVKSGEVSALALSLPATLEVRTVDIAADGFGSDTARLKRWHIDDSKGQRHLHIELLQPLAGDFVLRLGLVPRLAVVPGDVILSLPLPLNIKADGFGAGIIAYHLKDLDARASPQNLAVVVVSPELFSKTWRSLDSRARAEPTRAFSFSRNAPNAALRLNLTAPVPLVSQAINWQVQAFHADLTATCEIESNAEDLMLVEWHVPPEVVLTGVSGKHVRDWSRHDTLLQVWLLEPQREASITISGWVKNAQPLTKQGRFDVPHIHVSRPLPASTMVQVEGSPGIALVPERLQNLVRSPERELGGLLAFKVAQPQNLLYNGSFRLAHLPVKPDVGVLTTVQIRDQALAFTSFVDCRVPFGELRQVIVELRHWPDGEVKVRAAGVVPQVKREHLPDGRRLLLTLPPGVTRQFSFQLSGRRPLAASSEAIVPDVVVKEVDRMQRWLAVAGPATQVETGGGLQAVKKAAVELARWPDQAQRMARTGSAWQIMRDDWLVKLLPRAASGAVPIQVLLCEQEAVLGDRGGWVHQAHFLIFAAHSADLQVALPNGAQLVGLAIDNTPITPRLPSKGHCWVPLAGPAGPHSVRLRWRYSEGETIARPDLTPAAVKGANAVPVLGMIRVPAGYDADVLRSPLELVFRRAEAQMQLTRLLGERISTGAPPLSTQELLQAQQRFFAYCRQAEYMAVRSSRSAHWLARIKGLRRENGERARQYAYKKIKTEAEEKPALAADADTPDLFSLPANGRPIYWRQDGAAPPRVVLTSVDSERVENSLVATEVLLLILTALAVLSSFPRLCAVLAAFWPEQLLLLAWLGWYLLGGSLVGLLLGATGLAARLILLAGWARRLFRGAPSARAGSSYVSGSS